MNNDNGKKGWLPANVQHDAQNLTFWKKLNTSSICWIHRIYGLRLAGPCAWTFEAVQLCRWFSPRILAFHWPTKTCGFREKINLKDILLLFLSFLREKERIFCDRFFYQNKVEKYFLYNEMIKKLYLINIK